MRILAVVLALLLGLGAAQAQTLRMAIGVEPQTMDPHWLTGPDNVFNRHVFDRLVEQGEKQRLQPGLALSWTAVAPTVWEFRLRPNVRFHNGDPFTAEDVAFTFERARTITGSPSDVSVYLRQVSRVEIVDPLTLRIHSAQPYPLMPRDLSAVAIVSQATRGMATSDYNSGRAAIGTGPYRQMEYIPGDRVVLRRNDAYWGGAPPWAEVIVRPIRNDSARVAALLSGDVDLINAVPPSDVRQVSNDARFRLVREVGNRLIYIHLDSNRRESPQVTAKGGGALPDNPLRDARVRRALSLALNRDALVERVLDGVGAPAAQLLPDGYEGTSPRLRVDPFAPDEARQLLAQAGFPDGFAMTFPCPTDRFVRATQLCQAIGQMWTRIGLDVRVETMPGNVYLTRASRLEFSSVILAWSSDTGDVSSPLRALLASFDRDRGFGQANRGRYSSPRLDAALARALETLDDAERTRLLEQASEDGIGQHGLLPVFYQVNTWAMRRGLDYLPRAEEFPLAMLVRPAR
jgi:peptide/nickel transport system substrate-binding protein